MAKDFSSMEDSNRSANADIHSVSDPARRVWLHGGLAALASGVLSPLLPGCATTGTTTGRLLGFKAIAAVSTDTLVVPEGYSAEVIAAWGEPIGVASNMPVSYGWDSGKDSTRRRHRPQLSRSEPVQCIDSQQHYVARTAA